MNRTAAILVTAGVLALVAVILARGPEAPDTPTPKPPGSTDGPVSLSAALSNSHLLRGGDGEVYLDITLRGLDTGAHPSRLPLNVALVVDRSGSMAGEKLENARAAARRLVGALRDGDRLAVVTYGSDVTLLTPSTEISSVTRRAILADIERIVDRGGTFLSGGFERGRDEVARHAEAGALNRVILISDGQANEGITSSAALSAMARKALAAGIHLTTMGVGLEFNEDLMTALAEHGGGHYYFIEESSNLASIFSRELTTMASTVARRAEVTIALQPGVDLLHVYGYTYEKRGSRIVVQLPDVYSGEDRKIMCKLRVPAHSSGGAQQVAQVTLAYTDVERGGTHREVTRAAVTLTDEADQVRAGLNKEVMAKAEQATVAARLERAMEAYAGGDVAEAQATLKSQIDATSALNKKLKDRRLDSILSKMKRQLRATGEAAPASPAGRSLVKGAKYDAYKLAK